MDNKTATLAALQTKFNVSFEWEIKQNIKYESCITRKGETERGGTLTAGSKIHIQIPKAEDINDALTEVRVVAVGAYQERYIGLVLSISELDQQIAPVATKSENYTISYDM